MRVADTPDPAGRTTVLYIDDDETLGVLLRKNLERQGFIVVSALDGQSGLALLAAGGIDAVALDHYLLGETGLDVLPALVPLGVGTFASASR